MRLSRYYPLFWSGYRTVIGLLLVIFCRCWLYTNQLWPISLLSWSIVLKSFLSSFAILTTPANFCFYNFLIGKNIYPFPVCGLWDEANSHFGEIAHLAKKDEDGNISGIWGAMSDFSRSFQPWEGFQKGLYLAGVECNEDAKAPDGWTML